jgi:hypothetical protein
MCELDEQSKHKSALRRKRYMAQSQEEADHPVEYKGYWFSTPTNRTQAFAVIELACRATGASYETVRKFAAFKHEAAAASYPVNISIRKQSCSDSW